MLLPKHLLNLNFGLWWHALLFCQYTSWHPSLFTPSLPSCWPPPHPFGRRSLFCLVCGHLHHRHSYLLFHEAAGEATRSKVGVSHHCLSEIWMFMRRHREVTHKTWWPRNNFKTKWLSPCLMIQYVSTYLFNNQCQKILFSILLYFYIQLFSGNKHILVIATMRTGRHNITI